MAKDKKKNADAKKAKKVPSYSVLPSVSTYVFARPTINYPSKYDCPSMHHDMLEV